jgi:hypothetical protein
MVVMVEAGLHTWTCPGCGRRVPQRVAACHCGTSRAQAEEAARAAVAAAAPARPARSRLPIGRREVVAAMPRDVKGLLAAGAIVLAAGLGWLVLGPARPPAAPALLGYVDAGPPPVPKPTPRPQPPLRLPWWK